MWGRDGGVGGGRGVAWRGDGGVGRGRRSGRRGARALVHIELHVVRIETLVRNGLLLRLDASRVLRRVDRHSTVRIGEVGRHGLWGCGGREGRRERLVRGIGVEYDDMALLEVVDESVEVGEVELTASVVTALRRVYSKLTNARGKYE